MLLETSPGQTLEDRGARANESQGNPKATLKPGRGRRCRIAVFNHRMEPQMTRPLLDATRLLAFRLLRSDLARPHSTETGRPRARRTIRHPLPRPIAITRADLPF